MTIQEKIKWAKEEYDLKNCVVLYEKNNKAVYSAESAKCGKVILKINTNKDELTSEYNMLKELNGKSSCKVFEYEAAQGILIEEQIVPGIVLRNEQNMEVRINQFLRVFNNIHKIADNDNNFESYLDWLKRADEFCINNNVDESITNNMHKARHIGEELFFKYSDRVLLHGDLHHDNMLLNADGEYFIIDPKGVIGPAIFDLPRYILNEMDFVSDNQHKNHILQVIEMISKKTNYSLDDISKLLFMEVMLANVWCIEDGQEPDLYKISVALELLN